MRTAKSKATTQVTGIGHRLQSEPQQFIVIVEPEENAQAMSTTKLNPNRKVKYATKFSYDVPNSKPPGQKLPVQKKSPRLLHPSTSPPTNYTSIPIIPRDSADSYKEGSDCTTPATPCLLDAALKLGASSVDREHVNQQKREEESRSKIVTQLKEKIRTQAARILVLENQRIPQLEELVAEKDAVIENLQKDLDTLTQIQLDTELKLKASNDLIRKLVVQNEQLQPASPDPTPQPPLTHTEQAKPISRPQTPNPIFPSLPEALPPSQANKHIQTDSLPVVSPRPLVGVGSRSSVSTHVGDVSFDWTTGHVVSGQMNVLHVVIDVLRARLLGGGAKRETRRGGGQGRRGGEKEGDPKDERGPGRGDGASEGLGEVRAIEVGEVLWDVVVFLRVVGGFLGSVSKWMGRCVCGGHEQEDGEAEVADIVGQAINDVEDTLDGLVVRMLRSMRKIIKDTRHHGEQYGHSQLEEFSARIEKIQQVLAGPTHQSS